MLLPILIHHLFSAGENTFKTVMFWLIMTVCYFICYCNCIKNKRNYHKYSRRACCQQCQCKIMDKAKTVDISSFDRPDFYEKLENASREAGHRPIQILNSNFTIVSTAISMISFIVILWAISPFAPLIITLISIPSAVINFTYRRKNFLYMRHRSKDRRQMSYYSSLVTDKDMAKELRIFGLSDFFIGRYKKVFKNYFSWIEKAVRK